MSKTHTEYTMKEYLAKHSPEDLKKEATRILLKYPDRIPVIVCPTEKGCELPPLTRQKYLIPKDLTMGQFTYVIRKRIKLSPEKAIFLFVNNTMATTSSLMSEVYKQHKHSSNFLFVNISAESTFGGF